MIIIEPSFKPIFPEDFIDITKKIELIARKCYQSEGKICEGSDLKLIQKLLNNGHYPMFDHRVVSMSVICDRGVSHEIVRHRIAAYAQESTRYCNYGKAGHITFIKPCFLSDVPIGIFNTAKDALLVSNDTASYETAQWLFSMEATQAYYLAMLAIGCSPQEARSVLPNSLKTEIVMTLSLTAWRHFFKLRTAKAAHPQMREIARPMLRYFQEHIPLIFDDIFYND